MRVVVDSAEFVNPITENTNRSLLKTKWIDDDAERNGS